MWRLSEQLSGHCVHLGQDIVFIGSVAAKVDSIYVNGQKVLCWLFLPLADFLKYVSCRPPADS
jgi:hypothetical protein